MPTHHIVGIVVLVFFVCLALGFVYVTIYKRTGSDKKAAIGCLVSIALLWMAWMLLNLGALIWHIAFDPDLRSQ